MFIEYESIRNDDGCSFRFLHQKVKSTEFIWQYHYHPEVELTCIINGSGVRHVGHHMSRYEQGDLILIGSNLPHSGFGIDASSPHEEIVLQFPELMLSNSFTYFKELDKCKDLLDRARFGVSFYGDTYYKVRELLVGLLNIPSKQRLFGIMAIFQLLADSAEYELLNKTLIPSKQIMNAKGRLQIIFTYIEENYSEDLNIKEISQIVGLTIPSFSSYFKRTTSVTFTEFVNKFRIQKACFMLKEGKSVSETSYLCGYNSLSYFNRVFKKQLKVSPKEYKE